MTDKVQKIRKEVERLMNELIQEKEKGFGSDVDDACILELQNVLTCIDSLQKEPCDECTNRKGCITCENGELKETELSHSEVTKISDQEKPVSDVKTRVKEIFDSCEKIDISDVEKNRVAFGLLELEVFAKIFYEMGKQQKEPVSEDLKRKMKCKSDKTE